MQGRKGKRSRNLGGQVDLFNIIIKFQNRPKSIKRSFINCKLCAMSRTQQKKGKLLVWGVEGILDKISKEIYQNEEDSHS